VDKHLEIAWFGVDSKFQGQAGEDGIKISDSLYAIVEQRAEADDDFTPDMPITLTCHIDNVRGRRFWERLGYRIVGPPYAEVEKNRYHRMVR
jgi:ribosomal protein S18 acetylase RimI-like enzyme